MHALQEELLAGFRAWDGARMARAAASMVELVLERTLTAAELEDLTWDFREHLASVNAHPNKRGALYAGETMFSLDAEATWEERRPTAVGLHFAPHHNAPKALHERWEAAGFVTKMTLVPRSELQVPYPLTGEPDFKKVRRPTIHAPPSIELPPEQTWAAGRALAAGNGPLLARYRAGEREAVWREMDALGSGVRAPEVFGDAVDVALETMRRFRDAVEMLQSRLRTVGFVFRDADLCFIPAWDNPGALIAELEGKAGLLPLSLCAFYSCVSTVDFRGEHPDWEYPGEAIVDPLVVFPDSYILAYDEGNWSRHQYQLKIAPDRFQKEDISGGAPYTIFVPSADADATVDYEDSTPRFVELLRRAITLAGFPGYARLPVEKRPALLRELTDGVPLP